MRFKHAKPSKHKKLTLCIVIATVCTVIAVSVAAVFLIHSESSLTESSITSFTVTRVVTEKKTEPPTEKPKTVSTQPSTEKKSAMSKDIPEFTSLINEGGYSRDDLNGKQLIVVKSEGSRAKFSFFEKEKGAWKYSDVLSTVDGFVGTQGVSKNASEYESYTPEGLFSLGTGFGINDNPKTGLDYFKVTENSYWVDDVNSQYYNQHIEANSSEDAPNGEHLIDYKGYYDYAVFIEYNTNPAIPGKGSAFFLHIGNKPTAGCAAISEENMLKAIRWLNKNKNPYIMIF